MTGFVAGTLVHTKNGLVPIQNIKPDDWVLSRSDRELTEYKKVTGVNSLLSEEILRISCFKNDEMEEPTPAIYPQFASATQLFWVESTVEVKEYQKWEIASKLAGCSLLSNIRNENRLRFLDSHVVWDGCLDGLCVGGCDELTLVRTHQLDMIIQFTDDNYYFVNLDKYNLDYQVEDFEIIKSDYIYDSVVDNIYNTSTPKRLAVKTYILKVEEYNSYFVGENGLWVSN